MPDEVKRALMEQVVLNHMNSIPSAKSQDVRSFTEAATNWFGRWWRMRRDWAQISPGYCALILDHEFATRPLPAGFAEKPFFRDAPDAGLGGQIYISDFSLARVFCDHGTHAGADSIYQKLKTLNLDSAPCVIFAPETGIILIAENGVNRPVVTTKLAEFDGNLTVANVDNLLTTFYNESLRYIETIPQLWWKPTNYIPIFEAEKMYQMLVHLYLRANTQGTWLVVREDHTNAGRTDLSLNALNPSVVFVVEMKVLKSFFYHEMGKPARKWTNKQNEDWAVSGIDQVIEYKTAKQAQEAFLLLYDMRKKHAEMKLVRKRCETEKVHLRKYDIFNTTARKVRASKPKRPKTR